MTIKTRYILILMVLAILTALALSTCFTSYSGGTGTIVINIGGGNSRAAFEPVEIKAFTHTITLTGPGETQTKTIEGEGSVEFELIPGMWNIDVRAVGKTLDDYFDEDFLNANFPTTMLRALSRETVEIKTGPNKPADIKMESATEVKSSKQLVAAIDIARNHSRKEVILISEDIVFERLDSPPNIDLGSNITFLADKPVKITFPSGGSTFSIGVYNNATLTLGRKGMSGHLTIDGNNSMWELFLVNEAELIMEEGVTLQNNNSRAVNVSGFDDGSKVIPGYFTMNGGEISNNKAWEGGGVIVYQYGIFTMNGGKISGNKANDGGGVYVGASGTFTMKEGSTISGNTADNNGGGVYVNNNGFDYEGKFYMEGGTISGNTAEYCGGGVYVAGDIIQYGTNSGIFIKTGGIIYGSIKDEILRNRAVQGVMSPSAEEVFGHAALVDCNINMSQFYGYKKERNSTAGNDVNLNAATDDQWKKIGFSII